MADASVRPARAGDIADIARIQVETWQFGYAKLLPPPVLEAITLEAATAAWTEAVTAAPTPKHHVLVAQEQEWVVGFVALGPAEELEDAQPDDPDPAGTVAIGPVVVELRWGRRGHGSRLMAAAVDTARADGATHAVIWIPEGDTVTREFLISAGWAPDGLARELDTGAGLLREIRLQALL
jgi:GNAT superfamily N-acetyltransferase